jgi:hypothetical protein
LDTNNPDTFPFVIGTSPFIDQPSRDVTPVGLGTQTHTASRRPIHSIRRRSKPKSEAAGLVDGQSALQLTEELDAVLLRCSSSGFGPSRHLP